MSTAKISLNENIELVCGVCQREYDYTLRQPYGQLFGGCGHSICFSCVNETTTRGQPCPICRSPIAVAWIPNEMLRGQVEVYMVSKRETDHLREQHRLLLEQVKSLAVKYEKFNGVPYEFDVDINIEPMAPLPSRELYDDPFALQYGRPGDAPNFQLFEAADTNMRLKVMSLYFTRMMEQLKINKYKIMTRIWM